MMCLRALGHDCNEDEVNKVMGARPMQGAAWEQALACAQHYGVRATLTTPSTVRQLKAWTDAGKPVMIAWNPEGREWSHASVVFDVDDDLNVYVADPNLPDPDETVRIVPKGDFYKKWYEKWPNYLVRRPALMLDREITVDGRQVMARNKTSFFDSQEGLAAAAAVLDDALAKVEEAHLLLTSRGGGRYPSLADEYSDAAAADSYLKRVSGALDKHVVALRRISGGRRASVRRVAGRYQG